MWPDIIRPAVTAAGFPEGETFADAHRRIVAEIEWIARRHPRGRVAVATHGDVVRMLVSHLSGAPLDAFQRIVADTASVSVVTLDRAATRVLLVNDTGGLARFGGTPTGPRKTSPRPKLRG